VEDGLAAVEAWVRTAGARWTLTAAPNDLALVTKAAPRPAGTLTSTVLEATSRPQLDPAGAVPAASRAALTRSRLAVLRATSRGVAPAARTWAAAPAPSTFTVSRPEASR
jgi:hypothetical protein